MNTGLDVINPGLYVSDCCGEELWFEEDQSFPRCWICKGLTQWEEVIDTPYQQVA
jgi:hypothetical protein